MIRELVCTVAFGAALETKLSSLIKLTFLASTPACLRIARKVPSGTPFAKAPRPKSEDAGPSLRSG